MAEVTQLDAWVAALAKELGVAPESVDVNALLDVAREAAHSVARPAAPLATFFVGYAMAMAGGTAAAASDAGAAVIGLAHRWVDEMPA